MSFLFQPHVHAPPRGNEPDIVVTPDILIDRLVAAQFENGTPSYFSMGVDRLSTAGEIQALGDVTGGNVGYLLVAAGFGTLLGLASDHTDHVLLPHSGAGARQICPKPVCRQAWRLADVADHAAQLIMRSWIEDAGGNRLLCQEVTASDVGLPDEVIAGHGLPAGAAVICAPQAPEMARGASAFAIEIEDPVRGRKLEHRYAVCALT